LQSCFQHSNALSFFESQLPFLFLHQTILSKSISILHLYVFQLISNFDVQTKSSQPFIQPFHQLDNNENS
jgi:hypothetical protein